MIRGPKKSSLVLPSRLPRSEKSRIFLVSPTRAFHHPAGFLGEALLEQAPPGCWILLQEQKSSSQAVRRDGNSPRDEKEAEMFLQHVQLAAAITGCQRELPQCPLGNCTTEEMLGHRGGWHEAELCPTSAPVPEPCSKAFPGTLQSDSAPRQRADLSGGSKGHMALTQRHQDSPFWPCLKHPHLPSRPVPAHRALSHQTLHEAGSKGILRVSCYLFNEAFAVRLEGWRKRMSSVAFFASSEAQRSINEKEIQGHQRHRMYKYPQSTGQILRCTQTRGDGTGEDH